MFAGVVGRTGDTGFTGATGATGATGEPVIKLHAVNRRRRQTQECPGKPLTDQQLVAYYSTMLNEQYK